MRALADAERLRRFLRELGREARDDTAIYLTGGATAVLFGWRDTTVDADILIVPERDALYRALPRLKEEPFVGRSPSWDPSCGLMDGAVSTKCLDSERADP